MIHSWKSNGGVQECRACGELYDGLNDGQSCPYLGYGTFTVTAVDPFTSPTVAAIRSKAVPVEPEDKETRLRAMVLPKFRGEEKCTHGGPDSPVFGEDLGLPWFGSTHPRTKDSMAALKRYVAVTHREWPICRHTGQPVDLEFDWKPADGGDGKLAVAYFKCMRCW